MDAIGIAVSLLRGAHVAALVSLFGTLLFATVVLPAAGDAATLRGLSLRLVSLSALGAAVTDIAWLFAQSAQISDANSVAMTLSAMPIVALRTQFGHWLLSRLVLLIAILLLRRRVGFPVLLVPAGATLAVQPLLGHAGAIGGGSGLQLIASEALHLLAAGAWLGGLLPLYLSVGRLTNASAATLCRAFTPIGLASVLLLAGTAIVQVAAFMGGLAGLFGTGYGHVALVKLGLFLVLLALAMLNRFVFTDRLASGVRIYMRLSIALEMLLGAFVVMTAGFLASLTPGTHEQPVWPFAWRPSLAAFYEPELRTELVMAMGVAIIGVGLAATGLLWRRVRWIALGAAGVPVALALPHFSLLFVAAYPTSFFSSPTEFAATAIVHGARLFATNCLACHGSDARGGGPAARSLPVPPADLTAAHFRAHGDGELYWFISHGFTTLEGVPTMPGFAGTISSEAIWDPDRLSARTKRRCRDAPDRTLARAGADASVRCAVWQWADDRSR